MPLLIAIVLISCKKDKSEVTSELKETNVIVDNKTVFKGEYVFYEDVGVFQTNTEIYGVIENDIMNLLNEKAEALKKEPTDMVIATVKAEVTDQKHDKLLWPKKIILKEVIAVSTVQNNNVVKLEK